MSVINTNYLALVSQNNLTKSQGALGQAIERLSSGLRINSAKDDAAGQAIANRFTANIKGLTQASRNANDGISIAQTTEGALNEINNNLQRIRELSVQAANGSNSPSDLTSIQDEINQRLDEIDRVAKQTTFNGQNVLATNDKLTIQVGSLDSEVIDINLRAINRDTLGLSNLNMENQFVSKNAAGESNFTPVTGTLNGLDNVTTISNTITPGTSAQWASFNSAAKTFTGFPGGYSGLAVNASDNALYAYKDVAGTNVYYAASFDPDTGTITVGASNALVSDATVTTDPGAVFDPGIPGGGGYVALGDVSTDMISTTDPTIDGFFLENSAGGAATLWAEIDGSYYKVAVTFTSGVPALSIDFTTGESAGTWTPAPSLTSGTYLAAFGTASVTLNYSAAAAAIGAAVSTMTYVKNEAGEQFVQVGTGSNAKFYAASYDSTTGVITAASTATNTAPDMTGVNALLGASNTTLVQYAGKEGYFVQQGTGDNAKYYAADMNSAGTVTLTRADGQAATNAAEAAQAEVMVDPLSALDKALQDVDSLRSELGAVQNRFQSTIANLANTVNNLSAARSRIEDADYAVEVSNMTRAQILQQAGTSVLAQANQVPQTVLSLLR